MRNFHENDRFTIHDKPAGRGLRLQIAQRQQSLRLPGTEQEEQMDMVSFAGGKADELSKNEKKIKFVLMRRIAAFGIVVLFAGAMLTGCGPKHTGGYNPYLDLVKDKPSRKIAKENAAQEKRTNKASKKKMKESRKKIYGK